MIEVLTKLSIYIQRHSTVTYKWLKRSPSSRELQNEEIVKEMKVREIPNLIKGTIYIKAGYMQQEIE